MSRKQSSFAHSTVNCGPSGARTAESAIYHVMNRGDRRKAIFQDDCDRRCFLETLGQCCAKTGWQVHALCLMGNHFHLVIETPQANLVAGMKWFLGTYTRRFNRRHKLFGHVFSGRYKCLIVEGSGTGYPRTVCDCRPAEKPYHRDLEVDRSTIAHGKLDTRLQLPGSALRKTKHPGVSKVRTDTFIESESRWDSEMEPPNEMSPLLTLDFGFLASGFWLLI